MGNKERIKQLEKFRKEDPDDPFNIYALALEYLHLDKAKSMELFEELLKNHPDYIGTYYHAAALFTEFGDNDRANNTYLKGIEVAKGKNETHALRELQSAYLNFQFETE